MRLNGWQRIGIVASVVWAIGAPIYLANIDFDRCRQRARDAYDSVPRYSLLWPTGPSSPWHLFRSGGS